jgi:hypothetical protein
VILGFDDIGSEGLKNCDLELPVHKAELLKGTVDSWEPLFLSLMCCLSYPKGLYPLKIQNGVKNIV